MICTRCGKSATLKRGDVPYCGTCALNLDWQELTRLIQDASVDTAVAGRPEVIAQAG
jgi:hypothetical protein